MIGPQDRKADRPSRVAARKPSEPDGSRPAPEGVAQISAAAFQRRRQFAQRAVDARRMTADEANARLMPWLAIAARCGAELPELVEYAITIAPSHIAGQNTPRRIRSDELCPKAEMLAELARARDEAIHRVIELDRKGVPDAHARTACQDAQDLQVLAIHLGCPPVKALPPVELGRAA